MTATQGLSCREIVELVSDFLDGDLDSEARTAFEAHLHSCPGCVRYVEQIRETVTVLGQVSSDNLSADAQAGLLEVFREFRRPVTDHRDNT